MSEALLLSILRERARATPDGLAFGSLSSDSSPSETLTYAQLERQARAVAAQLATLTKPGDRVLLLYPQGLAFVPAFLGCLYAGRIAVTGFPPQAPKIMARIRGILTDAEVACVLTEPGHQEAIAALLREEGFAGIQVRAGDHLAEPPATADWPEHPLAFLQYTSGSTGKPKGVMVGHAQIAANIRDLDASLGHDAQSRLVSWLPFFHDMGLIYGILTPLFVGFPSYLMPATAFLQRPLRWLEAISACGATHSAAPNFAYDLCVARSTPAERAALDLSRWRVAVNGAEPVRAETLARFAESFACAGFSEHAFCPSYGMAEATLKISCPSTRTAPLRCSLDSEALEAGRVAQAAPGARATVLVGCGTVAPGTELRVVDPHSHATLAEDRIGELWFAGPSVALGYWGQAEASAETFGALTAEGAGPFLRTGDLGFRRDGILYVCGRHKDLIVLRGANYFPSDLEQAVQADQPGLIPDCGAAFAVEVDGEEALVLVQEVAYGHDAPAQLEALLDGMTQTLAESFGLRPHELVLVRRRSLEKTTSGKLKRSACRAAWREGALKLLARRRLGTPSLEPAPEPATASHEHGAWLRQQLAARLGLRAELLDDQAPFGRYGLDSPAAAELSARLADRLGRPVPPTIFYDYPSLAQLEHYLAGAAQARGSDARQATDAIAVIGLACRFPGAADANAFWQLLERGGDAVGPAPPGRFASAAPQAGYLDEVELFDASFFGLSDQEAAAMDPQQRILLETVWDALADAALAPETLHGSASGVFVGISGFDHARLHLANPDQIDVFSGTGNALSIAANRISWLLDLAGPSFAIDSACSSSLLAVHQACASLRAGECSLAIAAGVNLLLTPDLTRSFTLAGLLSPDQRCKTFDAAADGYVRGEGCGVVLLKSAAAARADGNRILAQIIGSAVNQDGRSSSLTAPRGPAQAQVLRAALAAAGLAGGQLSYVEAHGSGTALGDTIELNTLREVLLEQRDQLPCHIGSVKTNLGHLEAAAGIAGLIKLVLMLEHGRIPAHLHFSQLNPLVRLDDTPLAIPAQSQDWPATDSPRRAGISAFGFGGTNVHLVLEQADAQADHTHQVRAWQRRRFPLPRGRAASATGKPEHRLLGVRQPMPAAMADHALWLIELDATSPIGLATHRVMGAAVLPMAALMEMALAAANLAMGARPWELQELELVEPLVLGADARQLQTLLVPTGPETARFTVHGRAASASPDQPWHLHAQARIAPAGGLP